MTSRHQGAVRLSREDRMRQILSAATNEFRSQGFEGASMSAIAKGAGIVEGCIYRFFTNKAELLTRCIEIWYEGMLHDYAVELSLISGTRARLQFMIWRHLKTVKDEPELCRLMFNLVRGSDGYRETEVFRLNSLYTARTMDIIREGLSKNGANTAIDLKLARDAIYGGIEHRVWNYLWGNGALDPDKIADALVDLVFNGIAVPDTLTSRLDAVQAELNTIMSTKYHTVKEDLDD